MEKVNRCEAARDGGHRNRKEAILAFVAAFMDTYGYLPSYREIGNAIGLRSPSSVARYIGILKREGRLVPLRGRKARAYGVSRRIELPIERDRAQRIQIDMADGGCVCFDCNVNYAEGRPVSLTFSGVLDATGLKGSVGRVVGCSADDVEG